jgi:hypothetical protein
MPRFIRFPASAFTAGVLNTGAQTGTVFDGLSGTGDNDVTYRLINADNVSPEFTPEAAAPSFLPSDIASLQGWYDASNTADITTSGNVVTAFAARAGSIGTLNTQGANGGPDSGTRTINSLNTLNVEGTESVIKAIGRTGLTIGYTGAVGKTIVALFNRDEALSGDNHVWGANGSGAGGTRFQITALAGPRIGNGTGHFSLSNGMNLVIGWVSGAGTQTASATLNGQLTPSTQSVTMNGVAIGSGADALYVGAWQGNQAQADVAFCEGMIFDAALSEADRQKVEGYLAHKWGQTALLPSGHPYKAVAP